VFSKCDRSRGIAVGRSVYINDDRQKQLYQLFGFSVLPALIGWLTHLLPIHLNLTIMALSYGIVLLVRTAKPWPGTLLPLLVFQPAPPPDHRGGVYRDADGGYQVGVIDSVAR
jgi:hypothetical protein